MNSLHLLKKVDEAKRDAAAHEPRGSGAGHDALRLCGELAEALCELNREVGQLRAEVTGLKRQLPGHKPGRLLEAMGPG